MLVVGIMDVQQLVSASAKQLVNAVKCRILLGGTQSAVLVGNEDAIVSHGLFALAGGGLTAAADTAVGAGHDLHKVEELLAALDLLDELIGVAETVCHGDLQSEISCGDLKGLDAVKTADAALGNACYGLGRDRAENVTDDRLRNAARYAEDNASAGRFLKSIPASVIIIASSCEVSTRSMSLSPSLTSSGRAASAFLAVQGMIATE